jgi:hypothetical protein
LAIDIEGGKKSVLFAGDEGVALGEESLDETLAALAQRRGGPTGRLSVFVETGDLLDHREQERVARPVIAFSGFTASRASRAPIDPTSSVPLGGSPKDAL